MQGLGSIPNTHLKRFSNTMISNFQCKLETIFQCRWMSLYLESKSFRKASLLHTFPAGQQYLTPLVHMQYVYLCFIAFFVSIISPYLINCSKTETVVLKFFGFFLETLTLKLTIQCPVFSIVVLSFISIIIFFNLNAFSKCLLVMLPKKTIHFFPSILYWYICMYFAVGCYYCMSDFPVFDWFFPFML